MPRAARCGAHVGTHAPGCISPRRGAGAILTGEGAAGHYDVGHDNLTGRKGRTHLGQFRFGP